MIVKVNVMRQGEKYVALAEGMAMCWSESDTIDGAINKFKDEYKGLLEMQFANKERIEFDFHVKF